MIKNNLKIFISATEQSGDNIGYNVIKEILRTNDQIIFEGVGGEGVLDAFKPATFNWTYSEQVVEQALERIQTI